MSKRKTELSDFTFTFAGYGHFRVTYRSPITGRVWSKTIDNMPLIDVTKNAEDGEVLRKDLNILKHKIKNN